jgi:heme exporter protein D
MSLIGSFVGRPPLGGSQRAFYRFCRLGGVQIFVFEARGVGLTALATAQVDTLRIKWLKLASVVTRNTRRIRLYLASNWPSAEVFAQAMSALRSP